MDEPSKVIRDRIHFSLPRAVISLVSASLLTNQMQKSLALSCLSWSLHVFFTLNSHRLLLLFSYLMAGRCNDNLGVWFNGTRLKCALIRMVLVIKHDAKGFLPKEKNICGREFPQSPRHDNSCLPKDQIIPLSHSGAFPWSASSSPA